MRGTPGRGTGGWAWITGGQCNRSSQLSSNGGVPGGHRTRHWPPKSLSHRGKHWPVLTIKQACSTRARCLTKRRKNKHPQRPSLGAQPPPTGGRHTNTAPSYSGNGGSRSKAQTPVLLAHPKGRVGPAQSLRGAWFPDRKLEAREVSSIATKSRSVVLSGAGLGTGGGQDVWVMEEVWVLVVKW